MSDLISESSNPDCCELLVELRGQSIVSFSRHQVLYIRRFPSLSSLVHRAFSSPPSSSRLTSPELPDQHDWYPPWMIQMKTRQHFSEHTANAVAPRVSSITLQKGKVIIPHPVFWVGTGQVTTRGSSSAAFGSQMANRCVRTGSNFSATFNQSPCEFGPETASNNKKFSSNPPIFNASSRLADRLPAITLATQSASDPKNGIPGFARNPARGPRVVTSREISPGCESCPTNATASGNC